jgi:hypothetical protein
MSRASRIGFPRTASGATSVQIQKQPSPAWKVEGNFLSLDLSSIPLPSETYVANTAWVEREGTAILLLFGKTDRDKAGALKTRVEFRFSLESFDTLWGVSKEFFQKLRAMMSALSMIPEANRGPADWKAMPAEKEHAVSASIAVMSHNGTAAEIDFYDLPVMEVSLSQRYKDLSRLQVRPLLRVFLTTGLLLTLLDECSKLVEEIRPMARFLPQGEAQS